MDREKLQELFKEMREHYPKELPVIKLNLGFQSKRFIEYPDRNRTSNGTDKK